MMETDRAQAAPDYDPRRSYFAIPGKYTYLRPGEGKL